MDNSYDLDEKELHALQNEEFFRIKAEATKKIEHQFASVRDALKNLIEERGIRFDDDVDASMGKIFKGENYLGLPYVVLDYPRHFSKNKVCAFRTMFWWGKFFSFTAHFSPIPSHIETAFLNKLKQSDVYLCVNDSPWNYYYEPDNYRKASELNESEIKSLLQKKFIKISAHLPIKDYKKLVPFCTKTFSLAMDLAEE